MTRYLVTGGAGFLGSHIVDRLRRGGNAEVFVPRSRDYDLTQKAGVERCLSDARPDIVIHTAARVGGIAANGRFPGTFFRDNALMGILLIEACRLARIKKFVCLGTICAYPKLTPIPFREEDLWNGYPEETNAAYGIAKKALLVMLQAYRQEFGFPGVYLLPVNLYGPRDNFDPESSHVIPGMIRKFLEARDSNRERVMLWGDGTATREFLYVDDAAAGVLAATEKYDGDEPVNLGSGDERSIRALAELIGRKVGFKGEVAWDTTRPNGQPRRKLDTSRAVERFDWNAETSLEEGLDRTIAWYQEHRPYTTVLPD